MSTISADPAIASITPDLLALRDMLANGAAPRIASFTAGSLEIEVCRTNGAIWAMIRRPDCGGVALRLAHLAGAFDVEKIKPSPGETLSLIVTSAAGRHAVVISAGSGALEHLRATVRFTPIASMVLPPSPRDLYPLDANDDPLGTDGTIEAAQQGLNAGVIYFRLEKPAFGNILYFQNLTAMNDYYRATGTKPEGVVGGTWPTLGHSLPTCPGQTAPAGRTLAAGVGLTISDAILVFRHEAPPDERESARQFLQMLGVAYRMIDLPPTEYRDWIDRASRTLRDLDRAPEATISHYGHRFVHPYVAAEYPDIMVQMSIVAAIHDWGKWSGAPHPLEAEFKAGLSKFYDPKLKTLRRYLPNVGDDKDADAVDSWYLYHPLLNLGRLAKGGDAAAKRLFFKSLDFAIRSAHHFKYKWPIHYKVTDFSVITETAGADGRGQTDVGGIYAWVMLQAFDLTGETQYLSEARAAIDAAIGLRFDVNYQANLTAWGAAACMRLWRITDEQIYLDQSYVYLASFFHHSTIWESEIELARHYRNFLGVTCLQDAPYMAIYECFDSYTAFEHYLSDSGPDLEPAARMLIAEYCKYALDRAWFYYPDALPREAISPDQRDTNGHVDRKLCFPLEDLYPDGQLAGQVGQEVYGAGAAFVFATRAFHHVDGAPFRIYCDHFVRARERTGDRALTLTLDGGETCSAGLSVVRLPRKKLPSVRVTTAGGDVLKARERTQDRIDYRIPANGRVILTW